MLRVCAIVLSVANPPILPPTHTFTLAPLAPPSGTQDRFEGPYYDYLQAPLQPLMDNLESQTYETFERDPVK